MCKDNTFVIQIFFLKSYEELVLAPAPAPSTVPAPAPAHAPAPSPCQSAAEIKNIQTMFV